MTATFTTPSTRSELNIKNLSFSIGGLHILKDVNLKSESAKITGLIGPNGAGKTTLLNCISGLYHPGSGDIRMNDMTIVGRSCYQVTRAGVGRTFQTPQVIDDLSVVENVMLGGQHRQKQRFLRQGFAILWQGSDEKVLRQSAEESLTKVGLEKIVNKPISECTHIERRLIELARALCGSPSILLLDEPCAGMSQTSRNLLAKTIIDLAESGTTILLVEHNVSFVASVSTTIAVLDQGAIIEHGAPQEVLESPRVIEAYLGHKWSKNTSQGQEK